MTKLLACVSQTLGRLGHGQNVRRPCAKWDLEQNSKSSEFRLNDIASIDPYAFFYDSVKLAATLQFELLIS